MSERITLVNPYVVYECPDCGVRVATDSPDSVPDCPDCGLLGVALEFVGLGEFISAESKAEIERLRREREMLAAGLIDSEECVKVLLDLFPDDVRPGVAGVVDRMGRRRRTALALLDGEKDGVVE